MVTKDKDTKGKFGGWVLGVLVVGMMGVGAWGADALVLAQPGEVTLKSGVVIEVMGVTGDGAAWWTLEGVTMKEGPGGRVAERAKEQKVTVSGTDRVVRVAVRVTPAPGQAVPSVSVSVPGQVGSSSQVTGGVWEGIVVARVAEKTETGTVRVAVATGAWKTVVENDGRGAESSGEYAIGGVMEREGKTVVVVAEPKGKAEVERRMTVTDKAGKEHASGESETLGGPGYQMRVFSFPDVAAGEVAKVTYAVRAFDQWVEFKNVALKEGAGGKVEVGTSDGGK